MDEVSCLGEMKLPTHGEEFAEVDQHGEAKLQSFKTYSFTLEFESTKFKEFPSKIMSFICGKWLSKCLWMNW